MRKQVRTARRLIRPAVDKRRKELEEAKQKGETVPKGADAVRWMLEVANGRPRDLVAAQLSLITAGVHITSEEMAKCILQLCDRPEFIKPLREEIVSVLKEFGWTKTALYKLRLMDSFLKEVQRIDGFFVGKFDLGKSVTRLHADTIQPPFRGMRRPRWSSPMALCCPKDRESSYPMTRFKVSMHRKVQKDYTLMGVCSSRQIRNFSLIQRTLTSKDSQTFEVWLGKRTATNTLQRLPLIWASDTVNTLVPGDSWWRARSRRLCVSSC